MARRVMMFQLSQLLVTVVLELHRCYQTSRCVKLSYINVYRDWSLDLLPNEVHGLSFELDCHCCMLWYHTGGHINSAATNMDVLDVWDAHPAGHTKMTKQTSLLTSSSQT